MKRLFGIAVVLLMLLGVGLSWLLSRRPPPIEGPPTVETRSPSETPTATSSATASPTPTPTLTASWTSSPTPTSTPTLSTLVIQITAVNPDVTLDAPAFTIQHATPTARPTERIPSPAAQVAFVVTGEMQSVQGWLRYTADHPAVQRIGKWERFTQTYRTAGSGYMFTNAPDAALSLRFIGSAARVRYARLYSYGVFEVRMDGRVLTTVDAYLPRSASGNGDFATTEVFALANDWHTLEIRPLNRHHPDSTNTFVAIDAIDIYQNGPAPTIAPHLPVLTATNTPSPAPVQRIQVLVAPPTIPPTPTLAPPQVSGIALTVAYDLNGDKAIEPGEGVVDLPVQLIAADTNRVVVTGRTDTQGYVYLETTGTAPLRLVVPYFNRFWDVPPRTAGTRITLLLPPANRPALIP